MHVPRTGNFLEDTNKECEIAPLWYLHADEAMYMLVIYLTPDDNYND